MVMEQAAKMVHFKNTKSLYARLFVSYFMKFTTILLTHVEFNPAVLRFTFFGSVVRNGLVLTKSGSTQSLSGYFLAHQISLHRIGTAF